METTNALDIALSALALAPPHSDEARAHATILAIMNQEGCAHFGEGDKLTDLIDAIVFG